MGRYDLTDEQYALIEPYLPTNSGKPGHRWHPHRPIINGIFWRLRAGTAIGWLKECRAVATRYEKLALNYLGLVKLAMIERYLRLLTRLSPHAIS